MASHVSTDNESSHEDIKTLDTSEVKVYDSLIFYGCESEEKRESENEEVDMSHLQFAFQQL